MNRRWSWRFDPHPLFEGNRKHPTLVGLDPYPKEVSSWQAEKLAL